MNNYYITVDADTLELLRKSIDITLGYWRMLTEQIGIDAGYGKIKLAQYQKLRDRIERETRNQK